MMIYLIKIIILFFLININIIEAKEENKILFSIQENLFTSIDLNKRILYLNILTNSSVNFSKQEFINDYISTLLFNQYAQEKNIKVKKEIIDQYYEDIMSNLNNDMKFELDISNIRKNILYDYQRKIILERFLKNKSNDLLEIKDNILNLYNTTIQYFIIDKVYENQINEINFKKISDSKILNKILNEKNIENTFFSKKIDNFNNIDEKIYKQISNENSFFYLSEDEFLTLGFVNKNLKKNIDLKFTLFQITTENSSVNIKNINCKNIEKISNANEKIIIKKYDKIKINKLNEYLRKNLKVVNDIIKINDDNNDTYIILCDIDYNLDLIKEVTLNEKIDKEVKKIEDSFINQKKIEYNFLLYNE